MIASLIVILACQLAGEAMARGFGLAIPGPVLGMALLFVLLLARDRFQRYLPAELGGDELVTTGQGLLTHLSLLFIPAGVGVVQNLGVFAEYGVALGAAVVVSSVLALLATVGTFLVVARVLERAHPDPGA